MDPKYTSEILEHLEKQNDLLMDAYRSMSHELHKLQVEEEMLMHKFYELTKQVEHQNIESDDNNNTENERKQEGQASEYSCGQR